MLDPRESLGYHCSLTFRAFQAALEARIRGQGLGPAQLIALAHLVAGGPLAQAELAARLGITAPAVHGLVGRMRREGWIRLEAMEEDGRVNLVVLTPRAREAWAEFSPTLRALLEDAYRGIPRAEIEAARSVLGRVRENLMRRKGERR